MKTYTVNANRNIQIRSLLAFKGESQGVHYDFRPWEEDNGNIDSVEVEVLSGQASVTAPPDPVTTASTTTFIGSGMLDSVGDFSGYYHGDSFIVSGFNSGTYISAGDSSLLSIQSAVSFPADGSGKSITLSPYLSISRLQITTAEEGSSLIKITASSLSNVLVTHLKVVSKDPSTHAGFPKDYV